MSKHPPRIMYIESKAEGLNGSARIGRVTYSKTGTTVYYQGKAFRKIQGFKANFIEAEVSDEFWASGRRCDRPKEYWISGPKRDARTVCTTAACQS